MTIFTFRNQHSPDSIIYRSRVWLSHLFVLLFLTSLCSCTNTKVVSHIDDEEFWGGVESEVWISGERKKIYAITRQGDGFMANYLGMRGNPYTTFTFDPPPWSRAYANRFTAEGWKDPRSLWFMYCIIMDVGESDYHRYLLSVNPLVMASSDERIWRGDSVYYAVHLVDLSKNIQVRKIHVLEGEYPIVDALEDHDIVIKRENIVNRTREINVDGMTLVEVLNSPELWQE